MKPLGFSHMQGAGCSWYLAGEGNREPSSCAQEQVHGLPSQALLSVTSSIAGFGLQGRRLTWVSPKDVVRTPVT